MRVAQARLALSAAIALMAIIAVFFYHARSMRGRILPLHAAVAPREILADACQTATLTVDADTDDRPQISINAQHRLVLERMNRTSTGWRIDVRAGIIPGSVKLHVVVPGYASADVPMETLLDASDRLEDGTPDFLRLDDDADAQAFRRWFTFLAEAQYFQAPELRAPEITDCAALIRYAYREALRKHDAPWAAAARLPLTPALDSVAKYEYPHTPLGPAAFRIKPGPFKGSDLAGGAFAQFADAQTLYRFNTHFVSRDLARAERGDVLFYRQVSDHMPFHSMIYLGESQISGGNARYVLYHTGPMGSDPGEIRRLAVHELLNFPQLEWRPLPGNPAFLGIYRWNILDKDL